ncbi:hypothetical protein ACFLVE_00065 [Chloroflexota bacterium]
MGTRLKLTVFICLVGLLVTLSLAGACAPQKKPVTDLVVKVDWVEPIAIAAKPYEIPKSLAGEYSIYHVLITINNPNDVLCTVEWLEATLWAGEIRSALQAETPIYIPPGKTVTVRMPVSMNTLNTVKWVVMHYLVGVPDAVETVLGTWKGIQDGTVNYQVTGAVRVQAEGAETVRHQNFDLRFP